MSKVITAPKALNKALLKEYMKYGKYSKYIHTASSPIKSGLINNGSFSYRKVKQKPQL